MSMQNKAVLIYSYDGYSDVWAPFFCFFFRYWPDCPYSIYLITNFQTYSDARVTSIPVGEHKGWGTNMRYVLDKIPERYLIYFHEDFFIQSPVNTQRISDLIQYVENNSIAYLRLCPAPGPDLPHENDLNVGEISKGSEYRMSLQSAIWDKNIIKQIIVEGENPWDMEIKGTVRSNQISEKFLSVREPAIDYYLTAVVKGKWVYDAVQLCKRKGVSIDLSHRPIDYMSKIRSLYDGWRKTPWIQEMAHVPILGKMARKAIWKLVSLL